MWFTYVGLNTSLFRKQILLEIEGIIVFIGVLFLFVKVRTSPEQNILPIEKLRSRLPKVFSSC
jgi:hypothetical protein